MARPTYTGERTTGGGRVTFTGSQETQGGRSTYQGGRAAHPPPAKKGGGGLGGLLGQIPGAALAGKTGSGLYHYAIESPAGFMKVEEAVRKTAAEDIGRAIHHPLETQSLHEFVHGRKGSEREKLGKLEAETGRATVGTVRHPLRDPAGTLLTASMFAGGVGGAISRAGAAGKVLRAGEGVGPALKAARAGVKPGVRTFKVGGETVTKPASKAASTRAVHRQLDKRLARAAAKTPGGRAERVVNWQAGKALEETLRTEENVAKGPAAALKAAGGKLKPHEQYALRVVAEGVPLEKRLTAAKVRQAAFATGRLERRRHAKRAKLLEQAKQVIPDHTGQPTLSSPRLQAVYDKMEKVAGGREQLAKELGLLTDEMIQGRKTAAGRIAAGGRYITPAEASRGAQLITSEAAGKARGAGRELRAYTKRATKEQRKLLVAEERARREAFAQGTSRSAMEKGVQARAAEANRAAERASSARGKAAALVARRSAQVERGHTGVLEQLTRPGAGAADAVGAVRALHLAQRSLREAKKAARRTGRGAGELAKRQSFESGQLVAAEREAEQAYRAAIGKLKRLEQQRLSQGVRSRISAAEMATEIRQAQAAAAKAAEAARAHAKTFTGDFEAGPGTVYVPDVAQRLGRSGAIGGVGQRGTVGAARSPVKYGYTGEAKVRAREPLETTKAVAEANLAVQKFSRLVKLQARLRKAASPEPRRSSDIAVRLDEIKAHESLPADVKQFVDDPTQLEHLSPAEQTGRFEQLRKSIVYGTEKEIQTMAPEQLAVFQRLHAAGKVGWVPKSLLGDLGKARAPLQATLGKAPVAIIDATNNATKMSVLYLKAAYAIPNLLGNAALALVQQGFAMPLNVAAAVRMSATLGPELTARIDTLMGEGFASALRGEQGIMSRATQVAANVWGKGVDTPFRRSAFRHEAAQEGFRTPQQIKSLLTDPAHHQTLINVGKRANRALIDYARLSGKEREIVRRVIFFYPWVKGATLYAGHLATEHPVIAGAMGQLGREGQQYSQETLGDRPSYLEGAFGMGGGIVNPNAAAILQTPAGVGNLLAGMVGAPTPGPNELASFLTPALSVGLNYAAGQNLFSGRPYKKSERNVPSVAWDTLGAGSPQAQLAQGLRGTSKSILYPSSPRTALGRFLLGGLYPRPYDPGRLAYLARRERSER